MNKGRVQNKKNYQTSVRDWSFQTPPPPLCELQSLFWFTENLKKKLIFMNLNRDWSLHRGGGERGGGLETSVSDWSLVLFLLDPSLTKQARNGDKFNAYTKQRNLLTTVNFFIISISQNISLNPVTGKLVLVIISQTLKLSHPVQQTERIKINLSPKQVF